MPLATKPSSSHQIHVKTQEMGQSSEARWETRTLNSGVKTGHGSTVANNAPHQHFATNEYFNFPDMDSLMHDFSGRHPEPEMNDPSPAQTGYRVDPTLNDDPVFYTFFSYNFMCISSNNSQWTNKYFGKLAKEMENVMLKPWTYKLI